MISETFKNGTFYTGDCFDVFPSIPDQSVDMILADLPYGTTQNKWDTVIPLDKLWKQYWRICRGPVVLTAQVPFSITLGHSCIEHLKYEWIWEKEAGTGFLNAKKQPLKNHENVLVFYKDQPTYNPKMRTGAIAAHNKKRGTSLNYGKDEKPVEGRNDGNGYYPESIIYFARDKGDRKFHPTQKPVELFEYLIRTYTNEGETVLDNVAGSGTTAVAAENTGRKWICMELDEVYAKQALERIHLEKGDSVVSQKKEGSIEVVKWRKSLPQGELINLFEIGGVR